MRAQPSEATPPCKFTPECHSSRRACALRPADKRADGVNLGMLERFVRSTRVVRPAPRAEVTVRGAEQARRARHGRRCRQVGATPGGGLGVGAPAALRACALGQNRTKCFRVERRRELPRHPAGWRRCVFVIVVVVENARTANTTTTSTCCCCCCTGCVPRGSVEVALDSDQGWVQCRCREMLLLLRWRGVGTRWRRRVARIVVTSACAALGCCSSAVRVTILSGRCVFLAVFWGNSVVRLERQQPVAKLLKRAHVEGRQASMSARLDVFALKRC
jgi:hypothetical protein